jgi:hypothetical protein
MCPWRRTVLGPNAWPGGRGWRNLGLPLPTGSGKEKTPPLPMQVHPLGGSSHSPCHGFRVLQQILFFIHSSLFPLSESFYPSPQPNTHTSCPWFASSPFTTQPPRCLQLKPLPPSSSWTLLNAHVCFLMCFPGLSLPLTVALTWWSRDLSRRIGSPLALTIIVFWAAREPAW